MVRAGWDAGGVVRVFHVEAAEGLGKLQFQAFDATGMDNGED